MLFYISHCHHSSASHISHGSQRASPRRLRPRQRPSPRGAVSRLRRQHRGHTPKSRCHNITDLLRTESMARVSGLSTSYMTGRAAANATNIPEGNATPSLLLVLRHTTLATGSALSSPGFSTLLA